MSSQSDSQMRFVIHYSEMPARLTLERSWSSYVVDSACSKSLGRPPQGSGRARRRRFRRQAWPTKLGNTVSHAERVRQTNVEGLSSRVNGLDAEMIPRRKSCNAIA